MHSLGDLQAAVRRALTGADSSAIAPMLTGGGDAGRRLAVHIRHHHASLVQVIVERYPATSWLVGLSLVTQAAREYVAVHPPRQPCLAEYGEGFAAFLAARAEAAAVPYLRDFVALEWMVGQVSVEVDCPSIGMDRLVAVNADDLWNVGLTCQPGVRYLGASWPVEELMGLYLRDEAPDQLAFTPAATRIEVRGARGEVRMARLAVGDFLFRSALAGGVALGDAAERALESDDGFDPGAALAALMADGLVTSIIPNGSPR